MSRRKKSNPASDLKKSVESLETEIRRLAVNLNRMAEAISRWVVCPGEAMNLLVSELRALRLLLDHNGEYRFIDRAHAAMMAKNPDSSAGQARNASVPEIPRNISDEHGEER